MSMITHRRGDPFEVQCEYLDFNNIPIDISALNITSQVRTQDGTLVTDLTVVKSAEVGQYTLRCADTSGWPLEILQWNVRYDGPSTDPVLIKVTPGVTA